MSMNIDGKTYPYYGKSKKNGCVVLFPMPGFGTVIVESTGSLPLGYYSESWNENNFFPLTEGEIVIQLP